MIQFSNPILFVFGTRTLTFKNTYLKQFTYCFILLRINIFILKGFLLFFLFSTLNAKMISCYLFQISPSSVIFFFSSLKSCIFRKLFFLIINVFYHIFLRKSLAFFLSLIVIFLCPRILSTI